MQIQAQLNRILGLSQDTGSYRRLKRAVGKVESARDYRVYNGEKLSVLTKNQADRLESMPMQSVYGRNQAIRRAASGGSVG